MSALKRSLPIPVWIFAIMYAGLGAGALFDFVHARIRHVWFDAGWITLYFSVAFGLLLRWRVSYVLFMLITAILIVISSLSVGVAMLSAFWGAYSESSPC